MILCIGRKNKFPTPIKQAKKQDLAKNISFKSFFFQIGCYYLTDQANISLNHQASTIIEF